MASCFKETCVCIEEAAVKLYGSHCLKVDERGLDDGSRADDVNQALAGRNTSKQNIEPILIGNYKTMNYFSQAASDVTIYLNTEEGFTVDGQNHYRVDENGVIDLTKPPGETSKEMAQKPINGYCHCRTISEINGTTSDPNLPTTGMTEFKMVDVKSADVQPIYSNNDGNLHHLQGKEDIDAPEYIDISNLKVPIECFLYPADVKPPTKRNNPVPPFLKRNRQSKCKPAVVTSTNDSRPGGSDDEVIFVKEFRAEDKGAGRFKNDANDPLDLSSAKPKHQFAPRRNPRRRVQLLKATNDLALKLSDADIYYGMSRSSLKDYYTETPRRPNRTTGAIFNPPSALTDVDYKQWPTDGMHERPVFNSATKKIDKFDIPKLRRGPVKNKEAAKPVPRKRRIVQRRMQKTKETDKSKTGEVNKEFAALTHGTMQEVIDYVLQVKEYNEIRRHGKSSTTSGDVEASKPENCMVIITETLMGKRKEQNLVNAAELLSDSCLLYSLANGISHADVAKYLNNFKKEDRTEE